MRAAAGREDHREGEKLALERVETEAQRLEREGAEEDGVSRLAEDHLGDRVALPVRRLRTGARCGSRSPGRTHASGAASTPSRARISPGTTE